MKLGTALKAAPRELKGVRQMVVTDQTEWLEILLESREREGNDYNADDQVPNTSLFLPQGVMNIREK